MKNQSITRSLFLSAVCASSLAAVPAFAENYPTTNNPPAQNDPNRPNVSGTVDRNDPGSTAGLTTGTDYSTRPAGVAQRHTEKAINKVSMLSSEDLRLSQIAAQRATNTQVRTFAQQAQLDSQNLQQEIDQLARTKNVMVPTGKNANDWADEESKWQKKDGEDFDEDYIKRVIKNHKDAIETLEDYSEDANAEADFTAFANKHLPKLRENLRQAQDIEKQVD